MRVDLDLDLVDLRVVLTVAECASYTRAAQKLGISQPAVSRRVTRLEQMLHAKLFRRLEGHFVLTEAGAAFCERAAEVSALMEGLPSSVMQFSVKPGGTVALGVPPRMGEQLIPSLLLAYTKKYPDVFLRIEQGYMSDLFEMLVDKRVDVAILAGNYDTSSVDLEQIFEHRVGIIYPASWRVKSPLGKPMPERLTIAECARLPLLIQSRNESMRQLVDTAFQSANLKPNIVMEVNSFILQKSLVLVGMGCVFASAPSLSEADQGSLYFAEMSDVSLVYPMYMATRKVGQPTLAAKLLVKMIQSHMVPIAKALRR